MPDIWASKSLVPTVQVLWGRGGGEANSNDSKKSDVFYVYSFNVLPQSLLCYVQYIILYIKYMSHYLSSTRTDVNSMKGDEVN
jgi:hypothetical protein